MRTRVQMSIRLSVVALAAAGFLVISRAAYSHEDGHPVTAVPISSSFGTPLQPAEGAHVAIVVPKPGAIISADRVPLEFTLIKGKRGEHVHAYVDGELMGMFKSERGTLLGIQPGAHVLELRVAAGDHRTELDATDRVEFHVE